MTDHHRPCSRTLARGVRVAVASLTGVALLTTAVASARADQPIPVYPSADQVAGAMAAAQSAAGQVATLDRQLAAARAMVAELSQQAAIASHLWP